MNRHAALVLAGLPLVLLALAAPGCGAPRSTALTTDDLRATATQMAAKLSESAFLAGRTPDSPRMVIAIDKVQNLTSDLIPEAQQWYLMARVRASQPVAALSAQRNIAFVIPAERLAAARAIDPDYARDRAPTHAMSATFRSATRAAALDRTDAYLCDFRITDLATGELAWTDIVEFKRAARGLSYD